jgi:hypothetical protein
MSTALTLWAIEDNLAALVNSEELAETPEQRAEWEADIVSALKTAVAKRDSVSGFLAHVDGQVGNIDAEIDRLQRLKSAYCHAAKRVEDMIRRTILELGPDEKGKFRKLEGKTCRFSIQKNPDSVEIHNEAAVPVEHKTLVVKLPATAWEEFLDSLDIDQRSALLASVKKADCEISRTSVKQALEAHEAKRNAAKQQAEADGREWNHALDEIGVPGARWRETSYRVVRK